MSLQGNTASFSLSELLQLLNINQYSGTLRVSNQHSTHRLFVRRGEVNMLPWPRGRDKEFSDFLLKEEQITRPQLEKVRPLIREGQGDLRSAILQLGFLNREEIQGLMRKLLEEELYETFMWEGAFFDFQRNIYAPEYHQAREKNELFPFEINGILMEGMRRSDEWKELVKSLRSPQLIFKRKSKLSEVFQSDEKLCEIYGQIDGQNSINQIAQKVNQSKFEVYSGLHLLLQNKVIEPISAELAKSAFSLELLKNNFGQAIGYLENTLVATSEQPKEQKEMVETLLSNEDFATSQEDYTLSLYVERESLAHLIGSLLTQEHRGTLLISVENRRKYIQLDEGEIRIFDNAPQDHLKLGKVLFRQGKIKRSQIDYGLTLRKSQEEPKLLGQILVEKNFVEEKDIQDVLKVKLLEDLAEVFFWDQAYFSFEKNSFQMAESQPMIHYSCPLTSELKEELLEIIHHWEDLLQQVSRKNTIFAPVPKEDDSSLYTDSREILTLINGQRSVDDLFRLSPFSKIKLCQILYWLLHEGYLRSYSEKELDENIEKALDEQRWQLAIKYCDSAYEQFHHNQYVERKEEIQKMDPTFEEGSEEYKLDGNLYNFPASDLFQLLHHNRRSGTLTIWGPEKTHSLFFSRGDFFLLFLKNENFLQQGEPAEFFQPEKEDYHNEILEIFYWKNAPFQFVTNYFPEHVYAPEARDFQIEYDTQLFLLESFNQRENIQMFSPDLPGLDCIVKTTEKKIPPLAKWSRWVSHVDGGHTVLDLFHHARDKDLIDFIQNVQELIEMEFLEVLSAQDTIQLIQTREDLDLKATLKLYQHLEVISPTAEVEERIQDFLTAYHFKDNKKQEQELDEESIVSVLRHIEKKDTFGTIFGLTTWGNVAVYLSQLEVWVCYLDCDLNLTTGLAQVTQRSDLNLEKAIQYSREKAVPLGQSLVQSGLLTSEEASLLIENKVVEDLLYLFSLPKERLKYHGELFPLESYDNLHRCLNLEEDLQGLFASLRLVYSQFCLQKVPIKDSLIFLPSQKEYRPGDILIPRLLDGKNTVGDLVAKIGGKKISAWVWLAYLMKEGKVELMEVESARIAGKRASQQGDFLRGKRYYEHALTLDPANGDLWTEYGRIGK